MTFLNSEKRPTGSAMLPVGFFISTLCLVLVAAGCNPDSDAREVTFDRGPFLENTVQSVILPAYSDYSSQCQALRNASEQCTAGQIDEQDIVSLRGFLRLTYLSWQHAALFDFGPAADRAFYLTTNTYPTDTSEIVAEISNENWTPGLPATLNSIGLPAMDYLLNHASAGEIADLMNSEPARFAHFQRLIDFLAEESSAVLYAWEHDFKARFVSSTGTEEGSSIGMLLNAFNEVYEQGIRKQKLGLPNGIMTFSETPQPHLVEAPFSETWSVELMHEALIGCENLYFGDRMQGDSQQIGIDDYLKSLGDFEYGIGLHNEISGQLSTAKAAVLSMQDPLGQYVVENQSATYDVFAELQSLVVLWKVDMMSSLGVLITYQDNDND